MVQGSLLRLRFDEFQARGVEIDIQNGFCVQSGLFGQALGQCRFIITSFFGCKGGVIGRLVVFSIPTL